MMMCFPDERSITAIRSDIRSIDRKRSEQDQTIDDERLVFFLIEKGAVETAPCMSLNDH